jgi:hypothetical protein
MAQGMVVLLWTPEIHSSGLGQVTTNAKGGLLPQDGYCVSRVFSGKVRIETNFGPLLKLILENNALFATLLIKFAVSVFHKNLNSLQPTVLYL